MNVNIFLLFRLVGSTSFFCLEIRRNMFKNEDIIYDFVGEI